MRLETKRLIIRPFCHDDIAPLAKISSDPDVMRYISGGVQSYEAIAKRVAHYMKCYETKHYSLFAVIEKASDVFIGFCGLIDQQVEGKYYVELGYRFDKSYWNKNLATEAASKVKEFALDTLTLDEIIAIIQPQNKASLRVAEKIGMKPKAKAIFHNIDVIVYGLVRQFRYTSCKLSS